MTGPESHLFWKQVTNEVGVVHGFKVRIVEIVFRWCQGHYFRMRTQFLPWKPSLVQNHNSLIMNLQSYSPGVRDFLLIIWPVWLHQVFKGRNEKCFGEIIHIKLPVNAQANLQIFVELSNVSLWEKLKKRRAPFLPTFWVEK